jgi:hypothetical protein
VLAYLAGERTETAVPVFGKDVPKH